MVEAFARAGVSLIGIVGRNQKTLDSTKTKDATQYPHVNIVTATADITDVTSIEAAFTEIRHTAKSPVDILISNAGYLSRPSTITGSEPRDMVDGRSKSTSRARSTRFERSIKSPRQRRRSSS
ncbi:hypothetical protein LTS15_009146 [Exophiala xenobiotica]|nr:hypothetical protein LTS15_009146 [Exophiala xenobiotica]